VPQGWLTCGLRRTVAPARFARWPWPLSLYVRQHSNEMTAQRQPWIWGLEQFGFSKRSLHALGARPVTVQISIPIAPQVYPSPAQYRRLLELSPQQRRESVRSWRVKEHGRLVRQLPTRDYETIRYNRAPVGVRLVIPASSVQKLFALRNAESVRIEAVAGRKPRVVAANGPRLYAVKARFVFQVEGQTKGTQLCEERVFALVARSEEHARRRAAAIFRAEESPSLLVSGRFARVVYGRDHRCL
jgi:hypothetical protein